MKLSLDPSVTKPQSITCESFVLATWYDAHPSVRRLWGIREAQGLRVVISMEPTLDTDDVYPAWLANCQAWARELHALTGAPVRLQLVGSCPPEGIEVRAGSAIVADLYWRDATLIPAYLAD
jgi:hypothetical protein